MFRDAFFIFVIITFYLGCKKGPKYYGNSIMYWDPYSSATILFSGGSVSNYESVSCVSPEFWDLKNGKWTKIAGPFDNLPNPWKSSYDSEGNILVFITDQLPYRVFAWDGSIWEEISNGFPQDLTNWPSILFNEISGRIEVYDFEKQSFCYFDDVWIPGEGIKIHDDWSEIVPYDQISDPIGKRIIFAGYVNIGGNEYNILFDICGGVMRLVDYVDENFFLHYLVHDDTRKEFILISCDFHIWNVYDITNDGLRPIKCQQGPTMYSFSLTYDPSYEGILVLGENKRHSFDLAYSETWLLKYSSESNAYEWSRIN